MNINLHSFLPTIYLVVLLCTGGFQTTLGQPKVPEDYFQSPLEIPLLLSGTFGELRSNHFHSGLDIKTEGRTGLPVFAVADGYVKRIKISHFGYGKAIYVQHTNGYSSVYAHLENVSPKLDTYIRKRQYAKESYQIELYPNASDLPVKKGEIIAYSGNTGGSGGPHLHFEIRDKNSRPMNPLLFGLEVKDSRKPNLLSLWVYPDSKDTTSHVDNSFQRKQLRLLTQKDGSYKTRPVNAFGKIGFGINAIDRQDRTSNKNGVYKVSTSLNGTPSFEVAMNRFSFSETRNINRHIDYGFFKNNKSRIRKLFIEKNDPLSIYTKLSDDGTINVQEGMTYNYEICIEDVEGNKTLVTVPIVGAKATTPFQKESTSGLTEIKYNEDFVWSKGRFNVYIPKGSLYKNAFVDFKVAGDTLILHKDEIPLHKKATIAVKVNDYATTDQKQMYVAELSDSDRSFYSTTTKKNDRFITKTRNFGRYTLGIDSIPPVITPINFSDQKWVSNLRYLKVKLEDQESGIDSFKATINGKFALMEYDYKTKTAFFDFNDNIPLATENKFTFVVLDNVGNTTTYNATFFRKN